MFQILGISNILPHFILTETTRGILENLNDFYNRSSVLNHIQFSSSWCTGRLQFLATLTSGRVIWPILANEMQMKIKRVIFLDKIFVNLYNIYITFFLYNLEPTYGDGRANRMETICLIESLLGGVFRMSRTTQSILDSIWVRSTYFLH